MGPGAAALSRGRMAPQDVFNAGTGTAASSAVTRAKSALTGQDVGRWRRIRSLYCLTCVATLKSVRISVAGLRGGQGGVRQRVGAEGMREDIGSARQQETHGVGQEGRRRGAVTVEITLDRFDIVFAIAPCAVEVFIHLRRRRRRERGDDKARIVASGHDFGFDNHPPGLGPGGRSIGELLIHTAAGGRALAMGLGSGGPLLVEPARLRHDRSSLAEQDGIARQAEDEIRSAAMGEHLEHFGGGK